MVHGNAVFIREETNCCLRDGDSFAFSLVHVASSLAEPTFYLLWCPPTKKVKGRLRQTT